MKPPVTLPTEHSEETTEEAGLLLELSREVTSSLDLQEVLDKSFAALRSLISFAGGAIQLIEDGMLYAAATDPPASAEAMSVRIPVGQGISGSIAATGKPVYIPDIWNDARIHPEGRKKGVSSGVRSYFGVPLIIQGAPVGVIQIDSPEPNGFPPHVRARLLAFTPTIAAAVQNALLFERERRMLEQIQDAERLQRDFLALVSHELRTPLTTVAGFAQTLNLHADQLDAEMVADFGHRIWRASRRLARVMGDLLDLSQLEQDRLPLEMQRIDLGTVVKAAASEQVSESHPLVISIADQLPHVDADPDRVRQIVGNLVSNARKFSPEGAPIAITVRSSNEVVVVSIEDRGRGIPTEIHDRIFDRFYQSEPAVTRSVEGLGVGLYLVRNLCDRMGVTIELHSVESVGTTFTLRFRASENAP